MIGFVGVGGLHFENISKTSMRSSIALKWRFSNDTGIGNVLEIKRFIEFYSSWKIQTSWIIRVGPGKLRCDRFPQKIILDANPHFNRVTVQFCEIIRKWTMLCSNRDSCTVLDLKSRAQLVCKTQIGRWKDPKIHFGRDIGIFAALPCYFARLSANGQWCVRIAILAWYWPSPS